MKSILCATDFSEHSAEALARAEQAAVAFGAQLVVLHVVEPMIYPVSYGLPPVAPLDYEGVARKGAEKALAALIEPIRQRGVTVRVQVETGHAASRICALAASLSADLVVVATHGRSGLGALLLGSTAQHVIRHCSVPVLTVRAKSRS